MNREIRTAPTRPPPGPGMPGWAVFGCEAVLPSVSPQQAALSLPSSNVTMIRPFCLKAGEAMISGIQMCRKPLISASPPGSPSAQGASCPSMHRFGDIHEKLGVLAADARSPCSGWNDSTCASQ